ncbi:MAG: hypothetical protein HYV75_06005 [Opitutae bacterium]|nr:hypothetical protein [Opitutae bacterium]
MNPSETVPAAPAPAGASVLDRVLRWIARLGLVGALTFLLGLAVITVSPFIATAFEALISPESNLPRLAGVLVLLFVIVVPAGLLWVAHRKHWGDSWRSLAAGYALLAPVFVWLAWDEPTVRYPVSIDELCPPGPQAEASWAVTLAYTARGHQPAPRKYSEPKSPRPAAQPEKPAEWQAYLEKNRTELHAAWAGLPEREWWAELNSFPVLGDLMPARFDAPIIKFPPYRAMAQLGCAEASLLALEGKGDEAMDTLLPLLEVGRKLEPSARSLVRFMVARIIQKMSLSTARFILDHATVSPDRRARLAAALQGGSGGPAGARRLLLIEYAISSNYLLHQFGDAPHQRPLWKRGLLGLFRFVYNPVATTNRYGALIAELADLAERRELAGFGTRAEAFVAANSRPHFKNMAGGLMLSMTIPSYAKVLDSYWKIEDQRAALAADLAR